MVSPPGPQPGASASSATSARKPKKYIKVPRFPLVERWYQRRPRLTSWALLAAGMEVLMTLFSWGTGLGFRQWIALAGATLLLAWLCVWIVFLEEEG